MSVESHKTIKKDKIQQCLTDILGRHKVKNQKLFSSFFKLFFRNAPYGDIQDWTSDHMFEVAHSVYEFSQKKETPYKLRVINRAWPHEAGNAGCTVIEVMAVNVPFLIDSITEELNSRGLAIEFIVHPMMEVTRKKNVLEQVSEFNLDSQREQSEAFIHIQLVRQVAASTVSDLEQTLDRILSDVLAATSDWRLMLAEMERIHGELLAAKLRIDYDDSFTEDEYIEAISLLDYLKDNHFTLLGAREYLFDKSGKTILKAQSGLGVLRDDAVVIFDGFRDSSDLPPEVVKFRQSKNPIAVRKSTQRSSVHRAVPMDVIFIKKYDNKGEVIGEYAFIGLFTSVVYAQSVMDVPFIKAKAKRILDQSEFRPQTHDYKALVDILEKYPRDEMFQSRTDHIFETSLRILELKERQRVSVFYRCDDFQRFINFMVYVPRDHFGTSLRLRIQHYLEKVTGGKCQNFFTTLGESSLARVIYIFKTENAQDIKLDVTKIETDIKIMTRSWIDSLRYDLIRVFGQEHGAELGKKYKHAFPKAYQASTLTESAICDIRKIEELEANGTITLELYQTKEEGDDYGLKIYHKDSPIGLSAILPILENMGLYIITEEPHRVVLGEGDDERMIWMHNFLIRSRQEDVIDVKAIKENFEKAFIDIWHGAKANDGLNALVIKKGLSVDQVGILRVYARYLKQAISSLSRGFVQETLCAYPDMAELFVEYFSTKFEPVFKGSRETKLSDLCQQIEEGFVQVSTLAEDNVLRGIYQTMTHTLRTNYYQGEGRDYVSVKLKSESIDILPLPRPYREIFVYSPYVEGVHLRGGAIARGGLRWSDRVDDYRTEVLGLMKAQMVKNAVIVPVGSKGGFICKKMPKDASRDDMQREAIRCYQTFISGLLDLTDNLVKDKIVQPSNVIPYDDVDPYLVVAADKGTATFSDIANGKSDAYGFWLEDAFASGGSAGYDHKKMGITAKGAWECVKRHFREVGKNIQEEDFSVVGVGDMSGDVFGNGMLLSKHIRLLAAFNHMHIFVDPTPDAASSWEERQRMFNLPRSTWMDYDQSKLSKGGMIYDRSAKSLELTPEIQECFGIKKKQVTPTELMKIILKSKVELLWFGGIGTYIKSEEESHLDVGDRANDMLRINGGDVQASVIGEGANLGVTQRGRIEFAKKGGRLNADFVDNSGGVDCSDHEVNIKILLSSVMSKGKMKIEQRNKLLEKMEEEVSTLVLRNNYQQTQAISLSEAKAANYIETHGSLIRSLEKKSMLNREVEFLPSEEEIQERVQNKKGLTRPELAILTSYSKIKLFNDLLESDFINNEALNESWLKTYFPTEIQKSYEKEILSHRLKNQIIATELAGSLVNRMGFAFVKMKMDKTGMSADAIARAYVIVKEICDLNQYWAKIEALDNHIDTNIQYELLIDVTRLADRLINWFLLNDDGTESIDKIVVTYKPAMDILKQSISSVLIGETKRSIQRRNRQFEKAGIESALAESLALLPVLGASFEMIRLSQESKADVLTVAKHYFVLGNRLSLDWIRDQGKLLKMDDYWQAIAVNGMIDDLYSAQAYIIRQVIQDEKKAMKKGEEPKKIIARWMNGHETFVLQFDEHMAMMKRLNNINLAHLTIAAQKIRHLGDF